MKEKNLWELMILDAAPPVNDLGSLAVGDIDGDGHTELVVGGSGGLLWYRPDTFERGVIDGGNFGVGLALEDIDSDGVLEVVTGQETGQPEFKIVWYKPNTNLSLPWTCHEIDTECNGSTHDLLFYDLVGDGNRELLANAAYCSVPGVFIYKPKGDLITPWHKYTVGTGIFSEGLSAGDINGDGKVEIVHGPDYYSPPDAGPFIGLWQHTVYAPNFREMSRTALIDITGNGRPDIVIAESEYPDGRVSWFENRLVEDPTHPWIEHELDRIVNFAHTLGARRDTDGTVVVFLAEMAAGGWNAPYNWDARLIEYTTIDHGQSWNREVLSRGAGTHQALVFDMDQDGSLEIVGKEWGEVRHIPRVQIWKQRETPSPLTHYKHRFLDRDKPHTATDILGVDVDGDGQLEVICGEWWYKITGQERYSIPGVYQVHTAYDLDGDGRQELIASKKSPTATNWYEALSSELCWLKPTDPVNGKWEEYSIGRGSGDWAHGSKVAPILPGGKLALLVSFHSAHNKPDRPDYPELFEVPDDPKQHPWSKRILAEIRYGEEMVPCDITRNGLSDIVAGAWWLENMGDGRFQPHQIVEDFYPARLAVADINGDGKPDIVLGEEVLDYANRITPWSRLAWFEHPDDPRSEPWTMHVIDKMRCPHSVAVADLDGDGQPEVICGEHDPFKPYRSRCRLLVYKKAEPQGRAWTMHVLDDRFEHHDGTKIIELSSGRLGIISHGWQDSLYVHLWEPDW